MMDDARLWWKKNWVPGKIYNLSFAENHLWKWLTGSNFLKNAVYLVLHMGFFFCECEHKTRGGQLKNSIVESIKSNWTPIKWLDFNCWVQPNANRKKKKKMKERNVKNRLKSTVFDCIRLSSIIFDCIQFVLNFCRYIFLILAYNSW